MRILFVGDVVGQPGRTLLRRLLPRLIHERQIDLTVVNGENAARGTGLTPRTAREIFQAGADVITTGNHVWARREVVDCLESDRILRPANYPDPAPGSGVTVLQGRDSTPVAVINLLGRLFMADVDDPFRSADRILAELGDRARVRLVDFHAEATSEKVALGWYLDGRVSAVIGTHTHVPTADERVLPGGTAYLTDAGMTGPYDSVIGVDTDRALRRFLTQRPERFVPASERLRLAGALIDVSPLDGRASSISRILVGDGGAEGLS